MCNQKRGPEPRGEKHLFSHFCTSVLPWNSNGTNRLCRMLRKEAKCCPLLDIHSYCTSKIKRPHHCQTKAIPGFRMSALHAFVIQCRYLFIYDLLSSQHVTAFSIQNSYSLLRKRTPVLYCTSELTSVSH